MSESVLVTCVSPSSSLMVPAALPSLTITVWGSSSDVEERGHMTVSVYHTDNLYYGASSMGDAEDITFTCMQNTDKVNGLYNQHRPRYLFS